MCKNVLNLSSEKKIPTFTAFTTLHASRSAKALAAAMEDLVPEPYGVGVFELEDGSGLLEIGGYFTEKPDEVAMAILSAAFGANAFVISELPETDWVAKVCRELKPVKAGIFFIHGSHDKNQVPHGAIGLLIDAAMAFGTGHHGTTLGCLKALNHLVSNGYVAKNVVDIGCGTAVLAMAAASIWPSLVLASDIDSLAVDVASANISANRLCNKVHCVQASGFDHFKIKSAAPFDLIFANILKQPLIDLAPSISKYIASDSYVILSGIFCHQVEEIMSYYSANGLYLYMEENIEDWTTLTLLKI